MNQRISQRLESEEHHPPKILRGVASEDELCPACQRQCRAEKQGLAMPNAGLSTEAPAGCKPKES